ncbi:hypothetical protein B0T25DRAFT_550450 [Lasiosphaeria hispida]|uniref:Uncharacterized protein n=1 Tax=Lasiosphaeria hispida TaxID=260671 RepID=A0AAJ0HA67_9PEZI|nr:hypothetical protein B0T25DRAFT_550450 [Lasiosphaeria hispida]
MTKLSSRLRGAPIQPGSCGGSAPRRTWGGGPREGHPTSTPIASFCVLECLKYSGADSVSLPPAILEDMSQMPDAIGMLKQLAMDVSFGGGNLASKAAGVFDLGVE